MIITATPLAGAFVVDPERREDERGFFARLWCERDFAQHGLNPRIAQVNVGFTVRRGGIRGMHYQDAPCEEVKVVRCTQGAIYDVAVDLRPESPTYGRWTAVELSAANRRMFYIPEGCAHGYQTLADNTEMYYHTSAMYAPDLCRGVPYDDPALAIPWPLAVTSISEADRRWPPFRWGPPVAPLRALHQAGQA